MESLPKCWQACLTSAQKAQLGSLRNGGLTAHRRRQGSKMRRGPVTNKASTERMEKDIRRKTRKKHSSEDKIRIVLEGLRGSCTNNQVVSLRWGALH